MAKQSNIFIGIYLPDTYQDKLDYLNKIFKDLKQLGKLGNRRDKRIQSKGFQFMIDQFITVWDKRKRQLEQQQSQNLEEGLNIETNIDNNKLNKSENINNHNETNKIEDKKENFSSDQIPNQPQVEERLDTSRGGGV